ncbi:hypothetical protein E2C01_065697 [Portunus trituberculatus]|uniref:Uncharacterized protein n=1 Tax=Portunus trituberculatus TaxID=210409 RepID=A0A5B7HG98_PORTR|nr:hypothetical protein [Portunus trituberculatus]
MRHRGGHGRVAGSWCGCGRPVGGRGRKPRRLAPGCGNPSAGHCGTPGLLVEGPSQTQLKTAAAAPRRWRCSGQSRDAPLAARP